MPLPVPGSQENWKSSPSSLVADKKKPGIFALLPLLKPELYLLQEHVVLAGGEVSVPPE